MRDLLRNPWLRLLALAGLVVLLAWLLLALRGVVTPFAVAFAVAYFLNPAVTALENVFARHQQRLGRRWLAPRAAAVALLSVIAVLVLVLVIVLVVPAVAGQVRDAARKMPEYMRVLRSKIEPAYERLHLRYPAQTDEMRLRLEEAARSKLPEVVLPLTHAIEAAFSSLLGFVLTVLDFIVVPVFAVYLLYDMNRIRLGARELVPYRYRPYVYSRLAEVDRLLSAFARGQVTVCLILGCFYAVALTIIGVPMGLLVGLGIGLFHLIPFMSAVLGLPLALLLSWLDDQSAHRLVVVAAIFLAGQFAESNFISPRIVGHTLGLHSVVIMLAVLVAGTLFGFAGMLVAVPVTAALSVFWADLHDLYLRSEFYRGGTPPPPVP
jgi:predicted PurR-regulated permease PerM